MVAQFRIREPPLIPGGWLIPQKSASFGGLHLFP